MARDVDHYDISLVDGESWFWESNATGAQASAVHPPCHAKWITWTRYFDTDIRLQRTDEHLPDAGQLLPAFMPDQYQPSLSPALANQHRCRGEEPRMFGRLQRGVRAGEVRQPRLLFG